jgi:hypothetical protein
MLGLWSESSVPLGDIKSASLTAGKRLWAVPRYRPYKGVLAEHCTPIRRGASAQNPTRGRPGQLQRDSSTVHPMLDSQLQVISSGVQLLTGPSVSGLNHSDSRTIITPIS